MQATGRGITLYIHIYEKRILPVVDVVYRKRQVRVQLREMLMLQNIGRAQVQPVIGRQPIEIPRTIDIVDTTIDIV